MSYNRSALLNILDLLCSPKYMNVDVELPTNVIAIEIQLCRRSAQWLFIVFHGKNLNIYRALSDSLSIPPTKNFPIFFALTI